ncbi:hypothetical protein CRG98_027387 [Punica granatum]|uniref:Uncharacterized protein n=1 Tax=Punica granatum TaxID=22663 RepID=A0A2I0J7K1_PUNGR|nr:hypothetical protein CRG98_027387 [Punica granatum]
MGPRLLVQCKEPTQTDFLLTWKQRVTIEQANQQNQEDVSQGGTDQNGEFDWSNDYTVEELFDVNGAAWALGKAGLERPCNDNQFAGGVLLGHINSLFSGDTK